MKTIKSLLAITALTLTGLVSQAQTNNKISGVIKETTSAQTLSGVTVTLIKANDSSIVKIGVTDQQGSFTFENPKPGTYKIMSTAAGYSKSYSDAVAFVGADISLGTLGVQRETKTLKEVSVTSKKPLIERKIDRTILNVDASILNTGSTALEVLETAPGVTVDRDGKVSLKGKQGVTILLDGKPAYVTGQELTNLLKSMPSSMLDQIEIMTNPSAKYDASGNSGIINIKTKKNKMKGFNGSATLSYGQGIGARTNSSVNANYRTGKVNLFGNYSYGTRNSYEDLSIHRNFRNLSTQKLETIFDQESQMNHKGNSNSIKAGADYYMNKKTTLGIVLTGYFTGDKNTGTNTTLLKNGLDQIDSILYATNFHNEKMSNTGANFNFRHVFDSTGKEITADFDYLNFHQDADQFFTNKYLNGDGTERKAATQLKGGLPTGINIYSVKIDYSMPVGKKSKIEAGVKSSYVETDNNALYQNNTSTGWVTDDGKTNHFIYKENINAAYVNFNTEVKKWGFQTGLRLENTIASGKQLGNSSRPDSSFKKNYTGLFPTVFISYNADKNNTLSINYGRRIDRPDYQDLNPFYYFLDEYTYQVGNTLLQPQYTHSIELSHTFKNFLTTTLNYGSTKGLFTEVFDQINSERKTFVTKKNIASRKDLGISVSVSAPLNKIWSTNVYTNLLKSDFSGELNGGNLNETGVVFTGNLSNQFKFKKGWSADLSGFYRTKGVEGQVIIDPMWQVSGGVQKQVLKNKGNVKFSVRDIFASQIFHGGIRYQDIDASFTSNGHRRIGTLSFTYKFGKPLKGQQPKRKTGGAGEEQGRIKIQNG
ncbi:outer membrane beta-barrel family protein [soil metagenome]